MKNLVVDTNVIIAALLTKNETSPTRELLRLLAADKLQLLYNNGILTEYEEVLKRKKFSFDSDIIESVLKLIRKHGKLSHSKHCDESFIDEKDRIFYEVALFANVKLITGNKKHFPEKEFILSPREYIELLKG